MNQPEPIPPQNHRHYLISFIATLVVAILVAAFYLIFLDNSDSPPSLEPENSGLQGFIKNDSDNLGFIKVESKDLKIPAAGVDQTNLVFNKDKNLGLYYFYTDSASNYENILQNLSKEATIFMASYSSTSGKWVTTPHSYFKKDATAEIEPANFKNQSIKPGQGLVFMTAADLTMYDVKDGSKFAKNDYKICENGEKGWNLFAAHTDNLNSIFQPCSEYLESIWIQKTTDTIDPKKTFNQINLSEIKETRLSHALVWVKFKDKPVVKTDVAETINVTAVGGNKTVTLNFTPKGSESKIKEYKIDYKKKSDSAYAPANGLPSNNNLTFTVSGLQDNTEYDFRITAFDADKNEISSITVSAKTLEAVIKTEPFTIKLLTEFQITANGQTQTAPIQYTDAVAGSTQKLYAFFELLTNEKITLESLTIERKGASGTIENFDKINFAILYEGKNYLTSEILDPKTDSQIIDGKNLEIDKNQKRYIGIAVDVASDAVQGNQDQFFITKIKYKINGESKEKTYTDLNGPSIKIVKDNIEPNVTVSTGTTIKQLTYEAGDSNVELGNFLFIANKDLKIKSIIFEDSVITTAQNESTLQDFTKLSLNGVDAVPGSDKTIQFVFSNGVDLTKIVQKTLSPTGELKATAKAGTHNFTLKSVTYLDGTEEFTQNYDNLFGNLILVSPSAEADAMVTNIEFSGSKDSVQVIYPGDENKEYNRFSIKTDKDVLLTELSLKIITDSSNITMFEKVDLEINGKKYLGDISLKNVNFQFTDGISFDDNFKITFTVKPTVPLGTLNALSLNADETSFKFNKPVAFKYPGTVAGPVLMAFGEIGGIEIKQATDSSTGVSGLKITWDEVPGTILNSDLIDITLNADLYLKNDEDTKVSAVDIINSELKITDVALEKKFDLNSQDVSALNPLIFDMWLEYEIQGVKTTSKHTVKEFFSN